MESSSSTASSKTHGEFFVDKDTFAKGVEVWKKVRIKTKEDDDILIKNS